MAKPDLFLYSDLGTSGDGRSRLAWVTSLPEFRKATGAKWGIRAAGGDDAECLALLPAGYEPTGNLSSDAARFKRTQKFLIQ